ncbi:MAG: preprotein translocase subunit SecE, partial [Anaerolineae bacterium]|nr:preprotein translocase subunit SecE [Anaerolineae bacterium]
ETRAEMKKVAWPTREEALNLTYIVLGVTFAFALFLGMLDWLFSQIFQLFLF